MGKEIKNKQEEWYNSGHIITNLIIAVIGLIIVISQAMAVNFSNSFAFFGSIINHNSVYLFILAYFIIIKTKFGKRYFNYLNVLLIFVYFIVTITSLLTIIQSFSLNTVLVFITNFVIFVYLFHTMLRDTRYWREYKLEDSPFNELSNDWYLYALVILSLLSLAVNLISTVVVSGIIMAILDMVFTILMGRYIFLYREFLDYKKKDVNNPGNFDSIRREIKNMANEVSSKVEEIVDETNIEEKVEAVKNKVVEVTKDVQDKVGASSKDSDDTQEKKTKSSSKTDKRKGTTKKQSTPKKGTKGTQTKKGDKK